MIIAPIAATLLQLAVSRQREYLADATAAEFLGEGRPLAQALGTLERGVQAIPMAVNPATEGALHRESAPQGRRLGALLDASADRGTDREAPPARPPRRPRLVAAHDRTRRGTGEIRCVAVDTGSALPGDRPRALVVGARAARAGADEARPPAPPVSRQVRAAARRGVLDRYVAPGGRVLDPFAGSGTTLVRRSNRATTRPGWTWRRSTALLMRVKTARYDLAALTGDLEAMSARVSGVRAERRPARERLRPPLVRTGRRRGADACARGRGRARARRRRPDRRCPRGPVGPADDPLRPRLPRTPQVGEY